MMWQFETPGYFTAYNLMAGHGWDLREGSAGVKQWQFYMSEANAAIELRHWLITRHGFRIANGNSYLRTASKNSVFEMTHTDPAQLTIALLSMCIIPEFVAVYEVGLT